MIILPPHLVHHSDGIGIAGRGRVCEARYWSDAAVCYSGEFCNCGALIGAVTLTGPTMTFSDGTGGSQRFVFFFGDNITVYDAANQP